MIRLSWQDNSTNETGFELLRQRSVNGVWTEGVTLNIAANATMYDDNVTSFGTYRYQVRAINSAGASAYTPWVTITYSDPMLVPPAAPSGLTVSLQSDRISVRLAWQDNSNNEQKFVIKREKKSGFRWTNLTTFDVPANSISYIDRPGSGQFRYSVYASNGAGNSAPTSTVTIKV